MTHDELKTLAEQWALGLGGSSAAGRRRLAQGYLALSVKLEEAVKFGKLVDDLRAEAEQEVSETGGALLRLQAKLEEAQASNNALHQELSMRDLLASGGIRGECLAGAERPAASPGEIVKACPHTEVGETYATFQCILCRQCGEEPAYFKRVKGPA